MQQDNITAPAGLSSALTSQDRQILVNLRRFIDELDYRQWIERTSLLRGLDRMLAAAHDVEVAP